MNGRRILLLTLISISLLISSLLITSAAFSMAGSRGSKPLKRLKRWAPSDERPPTLDGSTPSAAATSASAATGLSSSSENSEADRSPQPQPEAICGLPLLRLPKRVKPTHYDLLMMPNLTSLSFEGAVQIDIEIGTEPEMMMADSPEDPAPISPNGQESPSLNTLNPQRNQIVLHAGEQLTITKVWYREITGDSRRHKEEPEEMSNLDLDPDHHNRHSAAAPLNSNHLNGHNRSGDSINSTNWSEMRISDHAPEELLGGSYVQVESLCHDPSYELLVVSLSRELAPGSRGQLYVTFASLLSEDMRGFYRSDETGSSSNATVLREGEKPNRKYMATTQFQATEARRAFPCFDEPALKATFELTMISEAGSGDLKMKKPNGTTISTTTALFNMEPAYERILPARRHRSVGGQVEELQPRLQLVRFKKTPPLSTYLLAMVLGELEQLSRNVELAGGRKVKMSVRAPRGRSPEGAFALDTAARAYKQLTDYCAIALPMDKIDMVAVSDFEAGAMENWGLITFKDNQLLVDGTGEFSGPVQRSLVGGTVCHELAHQWFGNLVTMRWWNELWLNEGFATHFEYKLMNELYPSWDYHHNHYLLDSHILALNQDSQRQARAVKPPEVEMQDPREIDESFDAMSYNKGAAIIRILEEQVLGPEVFRRSLRRYLKQHQFSTASTEDLVKAMEQELVAAAPNERLPMSARLPLDELLDSWLEQPGHPLIEAELLANGHELRLRQVRFLANVRPYQMEPEELAQRWLVPVSLLLGSGDGSTGSDRVIAQWAVMRDEHLVLKLPDWFEAGNGDHWIKLNANFTGLYRCKYSLDLLERLRGPLTSGHLPPADRMNLLDEAHSLMVANQLPPAKLLGMLTWLRSEQHGAVLEVMVDSYRALLSLYELREPEVGDKLLELGRRLFGSMYGRQLEPFAEVSASADLAAAATTTTSTARGSTGNIEQVGRSSILSALVRVNHERAIVDALSLFNSSNKRVPVQLRPAVYAAVARRGSHEQHMRLLGALERMARSGPQRNHQGAWREELSRKAYGLASSNNGTRLQLLWEWMRKPEAAQVDRIDILNSALSFGAEGQQFVRRLLDTEAAELVAMNGGRPIGGLVEELAIAQGTSDQLREIESSFARVLSLHNVTSINSSSVPEVEDKNKTVTVVADWRASRTYIKRVVDWQSEVRVAGLEGLNSALDNYLGTGSLKPKPLTNATSEQRSRRDRPTVGRAYDTSTGSGGGFLDQAMGSIMHRSRSLMDLFTGYIY